MIPFNESRRLAGRLEEVCLTNTWGSSDALGQFGDSVVVVRNAGNNMDRTCLVKFSLSSRRDNGMSIVYFVSDSYDRSVLGLDHGQYFFWGVYEPAQGENLPPDLSEITSQLSPGDVRAVLFYYRSLPRVNGNLGRDRELSRDGELGKRSIITINGVRRCFGVENYFLSSMVYTRLVVGIDRERLQRIIFASDCGLIPIELQNLHKTAKALNPSCAE